MNPLDEDLMHTLIDLANKTGHATTQQIKQMFAEATVVFGVWKDDSAPQGSSFLILKGGKHLKDISIGGTPAATKIAAIPCDGFEHASAMKELFGDRDDDA